jgi:hypothetical protein
MFSVSALSASAAIVSPPVDKEKVLRYKPPDALEGRCRCFSGSSLCHPIRIAGSICAFYGGLARANQTKAGKETKTCAG